jgi:RimJ/RimL family protein N-acetyltransferase
MSDYIFRKMLKEDIRFFLGIRNECYEYLHDNRIFSLEECYDWFDKTNPDFYIINYKNQDIGYFRTSNYSEKNKNIYLGCDIHKDWRGKGLSYKAYVEFINYLFNEYDLNKITLEVLNNNTKAFNLYKKIGFVEEGKKREEIFRDDKYIDSIIMSILKKEWIKYYEL